MRSGIAIVLANAFAIEAAVVTFNCMKYHSRHVTSWKLLIPVDLHHLALVLLIIGNFTWVWVLVATSRDV